MNNCPDEVDRKEVGTTTLIEQEAKMGPTPEQPSLPEAVRVEDPSSSSLAGATATTTTTTSSTAPQPLTTAESSPVNNSISTTESSPVNNSVSTAESSTVNNSVSTAESSTVNTSIVTSSDPPLAPPEVVVPATRTPSVGSALTFSSNYTTRTTATNATTTTTATSTNRPGRRSWRQFLYRLPVLRELFPCQTRSDHFLREYQTSALRFMEAWEQQPAVEPTADSLLSSVDAAQLVYVYELTMEGMY